MTAHQDKMQKYNLIKYTISGILILLFCAFIALYIFENNMRDVKINLNGTVYAARTIDETYSEFIEKNNIPFDEEHDYININPGISLKAGQSNSFEIKSAFPVTIICDGTQKQVMTYKDTIGDVLEDNGITIYANDRIDKYTPETSVMEGMTIKVVRVTKDVEVIKSPIPYKIEVIENPTMGVNETNTVTKGSYGEHGIVNEVVYEDGEELYKKTLLNEIILPVTHEVIERGTIPVKTIQGSNETFLYSKVMEMDATAYTLDPIECGGKEPGHPLYGITRSGLPAARGRIAVDPSVIPLFTKVYVESLDGRFLDYGMSVAADTGSAIVGNIIDLYMEEKAEALRWGRRKVRVYFVYEK